MSFDVLFGEGALFSGVGEGDSRPGGKVASMDGCKQHGIDRKACCNVEVVDEGVDAGEVMGIQGGGSGAPLRCNRWMSLGKDRETPDFGAGEFAPAAKDDNAVLGEHSDCGVFKQILQLWSQTFPIPIRL